MTLHVFTTQEKLAEVERLIMESKRLTGADAAVLKAIAQDLRGRANGSPSVALYDVQRRVDAVARSKSSTGYDKAKLHELGEGVAVHWSTIKQALEMFGADAEIVAERDRR